MIVVDIATYYPTPHYRHLEILTQKPPHSATNQMKAMNSVAQSPASVAVSPPRTQPTTTITFAVSHAQPYGMQQAQNHYRTRGPNETAHQNGYRRPPSREIIFTTAPLSLATSQTCAYSAQLSASSTFFVINYIN